MVSDYLLIRRAAAELDRALRGARVRDVGVGEEGRVTLIFGGGGPATALTIDPFGTPPLLWLGDETELALQGEPGWVRTIGTVLRGLAVGAVRARRGDRVIAIEFGARSRFGVATASRLIVELVPRFGNVVLLKGDTVVAAAKTFSPAENPQRSIELGGAYAAPPLPSPVRIPRLAAAAGWTQDRAAELEALAENGGPIHVYGRGGELVQAHLIELPQYADAEHATVAALLPLFAEAALGRSAKRHGEARERRRTVLVRTLRGRLDALDERLAQLARRKAEAQERDRLRRAGEAIYAHLAEIPPHAALFRPSTEPGLEIVLDPELDAKANAAAYFARYRKAGAALPHLSRRRAALERERLQLETLLWEVERADPSALGEIEADLRGAPQPRRARRIEAVELPSGARIYVGRSPRENAQVTFALARPNDLWFHARNTPGAHVVLVASDGSPPSEAEIERAAILAATHSRARASGKVDVDYTRRKHVRKQRDAPPGMVWYTDFTTIRVTPASA